MVGPTERDGSIFLSPHYDDVALSCGGTVARAARAGPCRVVTVFAARPSGELSEFARFQHERWGTRDDPVDQRQAEDVEAIAILGATPEWLACPDAIYRGDLYLSDDDLFGPVKPDDSPTAAAVGQAIRELIDRYHPAILYAPVGIGGHVDHRLTRDAALALRSSSIEILLYEDFPYAATEGAVKRWTSELKMPLAPRLIDVTSTFDLRVNSIAAYKSQLPTIFRHHGAWESVVREYARELSGRTNGYAEQFWQVAI